MDKTAKVILALGNHSTLQKKLPSDFCSHLDTSFQSHIVYYHNTEHTIHQHGLQTSLDVVLILQEQRREAIQNRSGRKPGGDRERKMQSNSSCVRTSCSARAASRYYQSETTGSCGARAASPRLRCGGCASAIVKLIINRKRWGAAVLVRRARGSGAGDASAIVKLTTTNL